MQKWFPNPRFFPVRLEPEGRPEQLDDGLQPIRKPPASEGQVVQQLSFESELTPCV